MATALDIIKGALRNLGVLGRGASLSAEDSANALEALNQLLGTWSAEGLMVVSRTREELPIATQASSYTIGSGGDLNTVRPVSIEAATIRDGGTDYPLRLITVERYNQIATKSAAGRPERLYYESSYPLARLYFDLRPSTSSTLILDTLKPFTAFAGLTTAVSLPGEYERALKFNLAVDIAPEYGKGNSTPGAVIQNAGASKAAIENRNAASRVPALDIDAGLSGIPGPVNILSG